MCRENCRVGNEVGAGGFRVEDPNPICDPIGELMDIGSSIQLLYEVFEEKGDYGVSNILRLLGCRVREIAEKLEDEKWEAPSQEELEAQRKERMENACPRLDPLTSDDEIISMLQDVFVGDENAAASIKGLINIAHHDLPKRQENAA